MKKLLLLIGFAFIISGCAPPPYWTYTDKANHVAKSKSFQMTVPKGWERTTRPDRYEYLNLDGKNVPILLESMTVTRDGTGIQAITVTRHYPDTAFPTIKKKSRSNMLPVDLADLFVSELRKRSGLEQLKVLDNKPTMVDGKQAFRLLMQFKNDDGLRIRIASYGFVDKTGFYTISYRAPYLYYYKRDYRAFKKLVASFKQLKGAFDPPPKMPAWAKLFT